MILFVNCNRVKSDKTVFLKKYSYSRCNTFTASSFVFIFTNVKVLNLIISVHRWEYSQTTASVSVQINTVHLHSHGPETHTHTHTHTFIQCCKSYSGSVQDRGFYLSELSSGFGSLEASDWLPLLAETVGLTTTSLTSVNSACGMTQGSVSASVSWSSVSGIWYNYMIKLYSLQAINAIYFS